MNNQVIFSNCLAFLGPITVIGYSRRSPKVTFPTLHSLFMTAKLTDFYMMNCELITREGFLITWAEPKTTGSFGR